MINFGLNPQRDRNTEENSGWNEKGIGTLNKPSGKDGRKPHQQNEWSKK